LHIPKKDIVKTLIKIKDVLRKGGILYLSVKRGKGEEFAEDARYCNVKKFWSYFGRREMESLLKECGFEIIQSYIDKSGKTYATHPWICIFSRISRVK